MLLRLVWSAMVVIALVMNVAVTWLLIEPLLCAQGFWTCLVSVLLHTTSRLLL
jgi:hypothetical protein